MKAFVTIMFAAASFLFIMFMNPNAFGEDSAEDTNAANHASVKSLMHEIFYSLSALRTYMVSEDKFKDPKNSLVIDLELAKLKDRIKKAAHEPMLQGPNFKITRQVLQDHVAETERLFRHGNKDYARWSLNSTMSICMSCHSQLPSNSTNGLILEQSGIFAKSFERAEWLFVARNFDKALELYNNSIRSFPANKLTPDQVEASLERKAAIYTRIKRDYKGGAADFEKDLKNKDLPPYVQKNIQAWIKTLNKYSSEKLPNPATATPEAIRKFAEKHLNTKEILEEGENPKAALYLAVSGILYEYLNKHPSTNLTPELLYWLAECDREINNNFFYSLADVYLKQCMLEFPSHPIAKKCYDNYELYTIASYSGSSGTHLPDEVSDELNTLKKLVNSGAAKTLRKK